MMNVSSLRTSFSHFVSDTVENMLLVVDSIISMRYIIPDSIIWVWRKYGSGSPHIRTIKLQATSGKTTRVAYLNIHGNLSHQSKCPVLLCHGDYGHPYTMVQYGNIASQTGHPTFSLYVPQVAIEENFILSNELLCKGMNEIKTIMKQEYKKFVWYKRWLKCLMPFRILGAGHSSGGIHLAYRQFVANDNRIKSSFVVGAPLRVLDESKQRSSILLIPHWRKIASGIKWYTNKPIVQVVAKDDWNSSQESMMVRPKDHCFSVPGMHLSGLYKPETYRHFRHFLTEFG